jgi:hypothetical protein
VSHGISLPNQNQSETATANQKEKYHHYSLIPCHYKRQQKNSLQKDDC